MRAELAQRCSCTEALLGLHLDLCHVDNLRRPGGCARSANQLDGGVQLSIRPLVGATQRVSQGDKDGACLPSKPLHAL